MSVGEIQEAVEAAGPTLSHHLDILRRGGLVESRREERYIYYSVQREPVTGLVRLLTACCEGSDERKTPSRHARLRVREEPGGVPGTAGGDPGHGRGGL